jgi:acyl-CoA synthetase (AMP-forming)/AMP-acid ligase II
MVCKGYTDPEMTAEAFDADGYFRTGDVGHLRPDGHVVLTGRLKDIIIRKGENISAKEIEDLLYEHPKVADVAVIGLADRQRGERVCAVVQSAPGTDPLSFEEMVAHLSAAGLMAQKIPEQLEIVDAPPLKQRSLRGHRSDGGNKMTSSTSCARDRRPVRNRQPGQCCRGLGPPCPTTGASPWCPHPSARPPRHRGRWGVSWPGSRTPWTPSPCRWTPDRTRPGWRRGRRRWWSR